MADILVVEPDREVRALIVELLSGAGHELVVCPNGAHALSKLEEHRFELILSDLTIPGTPGLALYWELVRRWPDLIQRTIYLGGPLDARSAEYRLMVDEEIPFLIKPFTGPTLLHVVRFMLERHV